MTECETPGKVHKIQTKLISIPNISALLSLPVLERYIENASHNVNFVACTMHFHNKM